MTRMFFIRSGRAGTLDTLQQINQFGAQAVASVPLWSRNFPVSSWDSILRSYWVYVAPRSVNGTDAQQVFNLKDMLRGDCAQAALVAVALAIANGLAYRIVAMRRPEDTDFSHVFVEVGRPGEPAFRIDPTAPQDADYTHWERMTYP